mgnify:CR=1 FL=1
MKRATWYRRFHVSIDLESPFRKAQGRPVRCSKPSMVLRRVARRPEGSTPHRNERWPQCYPTRQLICRRPSTASKAIATVRVAIAMRKRRQGIAW